MRVKRFRLLEIIAARVIRKRKIEEKVRSFALRVDEAIRKAIDCQMRRSKTQLLWFRNRSDKHHYHFSSSRCFYTRFCIACYCFS